MSAINSTGSPSPEHADSHDDHGSTPAAWTAVTIITIAFAVGTLAIVLANWTMFWVGVALLIVGAVVGRVMQAMGLGKARSGANASDQHPVSGA